MTVPWPLHPADWSRATAPLGVSLPHCGAAPLLKGLAEVTGTDEWSHQV